MDASLRSSFRDLGLVGRWGGSLYGQLEFAVALRASHVILLPSCRSNRGDLLLAHLDSNHHGMDWLLGPLQEEAQERNQRNPGKRREADRNLAQA